MGTLWGRIIRQEGISQFAVILAREARASSVMSQTPTPILLFFCFAFSSSVPAGSKPSIISINPLKNIRLFAYSPRSGNNKYHLRNLRYRGPLPRHHHTNESFAMSSVGIIPSDEIILKDVSFGPIVCYVMS